MRPPALNLKNCRIKKVFTNNINDTNASCASGSQRSSLELEFGGLSPTRLSMFNLEDPLPSPILERPMRIRRSIRNALSEESVDLPMTPDSSRIASQAPFIYSGPPLVMNPDGSVQSPHRKPDLIIKSSIKKFCTPKPALKPLYSPPFEFLKRVLYDIPEEPEEEEMHESNGKETALTEDSLPDDEGFETVPTSILKPRLKHRGFVVADGQDVAEALRLWVGNEETPDIKTEEVNESHANNISSSSEYDKSFVESSMWRNTW